MQICLFNCTTLIIWNWSHINHRFCIQIKLKYPDIITVSPSTFNGTSMNKIIFDIDQWWMIVILLVNNFLDNSWFNFIHSFLTIVNLQIPHMSFCYHGADIPIISNLFTDINWIMADGGCFGTGVQTVDMVAQRLL